MDILNFEDENTSHQHHNSEEQTSTVPLKKPKI